MRTGKAERRPSLRVALVHNPKSGSDTFGRDALCAAVEQAGHEATYYSRDALDEVKELDTDLIAAAGGDGTVGKVMKAVAETRNAPVTILPIGTANNIARSLGIVENVETLIGRWETSSRQPFFLPTVRMKGKSALFVEGFGLGVFPEMVHSLKKARAESGRAKEETEQDILQLLLEETRTLEPIEIEVKMDGVKSREACLLFEVMNIRSVGPNLLLSTTPIPTAPRFEVARIDEGQRKQFVQYLEGRLRGENHPPDIATVQCEEIRVRWTGGRRFHLDDRLRPRGTDVKPKRVEVEMWFGGNWIELLIPPAGERRGETGRQ